LNACRWNKRLLFAAPLLLLAAPLLLLGLLLQPSERVTHPGPLTEQQRQHVEQLVVDNSPPRLEASGYSEISLDAAELNLLLHFALAQVPALAETAARVDLSAPSIRLELSHALPLGRWQRYLNVDGDFVLENDRIVLQRLRTGRLGWPRVLHPLLWRQGEALLANYNISQLEIIDLEQALQDLRIEEERLHARVQWRRNTLEELREQAQQWLVSDEDRQRLIHYYRIIQQQVDGARQPSLQSLMPSLFASAGQRSENGGELAVAENRALLQALTLYVNQLDPSLLIHKPPDDLLRAPPRSRITLLGRHDLSRHYVTSAAIAASTGVAIAEVLANSKELHDARYSSGFSFSDIMANMAGLTLGQHAVDEDTAQHLQQRLQQAVTESDYMPSVSHLEDGLSEAEFIERYGSRDSSLYQQQIRDFEMQIRQLPTFR
jgi:uncharacterized protein YfiM (DUF2279 family)